MSADERTIAAYDARAGAYAERFDAAGPDRNLQDFIAALATGARVLDLGCGPGNASAFMRAAGLKPDPIDASAKMVALANARHAIGARLATFDDIGGVGEYEAVWANFSLLHAARGRSGGISLAIPAKDINIGSVIRRMEEDFSVVECLQRDGGTCLISPACRLKAIAAEALEAYLRVFDSYTLADLVRNEAALAALLGDGKSGPSARALPD